MSEYTFLLGSGVSLESGVQSVNAITNAIFEEKYFEHTDGSFVRGEYPSEVLRDHYDVSEIQSFLELIIKYSDNYIKERLGDNQTANFEDIYFVVEQLHQEATNTRDNAAIKPFYDQIEKESFEIREGYHGFDEPIDMNNITFKSLRFIESVIKYGLNFEEVKGVSLLEEILNEGNSVNFFTLNHDLLIEALCDNLGISYSDGFSEPDGQVRWYNPETWDYANQAKIYKLHGSRNWYLVRSEKIGQEYAILTGEDKWHSKDGDGDKVDLHIDYGYLLTGENKAENYYSGLHGEIHTRFSNHLKNTKNIVISGYGWNDYQLNRKLFDWLSLDDENQMIIIHEDPKDMAANSRHISYNQLLHRKRFDQVHFIKEWFQHATFKQLKDLME